MAGEEPATLSEFARDLVGWLKCAYPDASPVTSAAIEKQMHDTWHRRHEIVRGGA